jgi:asparagine synthase (glutamine-hydrolysing)
MCGICGVYNYLSGGRDVPPTRVEAMCGELRHRGPDDTGVFVDGPLGIGMTRLSIVDLQTGHQPILSEDRNVAVVCNGEIYNYPELREDLEEKGHKFSTHSDTESILHLYEEYGLRFAEHLRGMFALAVWDRREARLIVARDRLGIKPLHVSDRDGTFAFASELKALLMLPGMDRTLDPTSLDAYLTLSYVPAPRTILKGISKVMPGTMVIVDRSGVRTERYWQMRFPLRGERRPLAEEEVCERLRALMRETVRAHLLADVQVGAFLSGGIDSSVVVALMSEFTPRVKTFSIGFRESSYDELRYARTVAGLFGTDHTELIVEPAHAAALGELVSYIEEPFGDLSAIPVYFLSGLARKDVKVVLSGDGCDELFAGYLTYVADHLARIYRFIPQTFRNGVIRRMVERLPTSYEKVSFDYKAKRFVEVADQPVLQSHLGWKQIFGAADRERLYRRDYLETTDVGDSLAPLTRCFEEARGYEFLDQLLHVDIGTYLADDILTKVDRMSMAHSLEVRVPFLDHLVVEFAGSLPPGLKMNGFRTKYIVKKAFRGLLPHEIRNRKKAGFIFPASLWLRGSLLEFASDLLSESRMASLGIFNPGFVQSLLKEHSEGRRDRARMIWNLLVFSAWHGRYLEGAGVAAVRPTA